MAITIKSNASGTTSVIYPAGIVSGNLILLAAGTYETVRIDMPAGFTALISASALSTYTNSSNLWYKIAVGNESGTTISLTGGSPTLMSASMLVITGQSPSNPIHVYNSQSSTTNPFNTGNVTTTSKTQRYAFFTQMTNTNVLPSFSVVGTQTLVNTQVSGQNSYWRISAYSQNAEESAGTLASAQITSDQSGANIGMVVGILSNASPDAPTNLVPANIAVNNSGVTANFSWTHNDTESNPQTAAEISYRVKGSTAAYTVVTSNSATQSYSFASGTFINGEEYEYIIRTKDSGSGFFGSFSTPTYFTGGNNLWSYGPVIASSTQSGILASSIYTNDFESQIIGWESNSVFGTYIQAAVIRGTSRMQAGSASLEVTWPTGLSWVDILPTNSPLTIGKIYSISCWVFVPAGSPNVKLDALFTTTTTGMPIVTTKDAWVFTTGTFVAHANSIYLGVKMSSGQTGTSGQKMFIDNFNVVEVLPSVGTYYIESRTSDLEGFGPWSAQSPTFIVRPASNTYVRSGGAWVLKVRYKRVAGAMTEAGVTKVKVGGVFAP